jgi:hypothetical protein
VKLVIQSSALRAAMLDPDRDESDECDRPLTRAELEARAVAMTTKPQAEVCCGIVFVFPPSRSVDSRCLSSAGH